MVGSSDVYTYYLNTYISYDKWYLEVTFYSYHHRNLLPISNTHFLTASYGNYYSSRYLCKKVVFLLHICVNHMCNVTMYLAEGRTRTRDCSLGVPRQQVPHQCYFIIIDMHCIKYSRYYRSPIALQKMQKITWLRKKNIICI